MSTKVSMCVERQVEQVGYFEFSTKHSPEVIEKWIISKDFTEKRDNKFENDIDDWENNSSTETFSYVDSFEEGEGDDYCKYDDDITRWFDATNRTMYALKMDMNSIFSSGCDIQKITDFIKKNEELYNSLSKKEVITDLTEDEKDVFYGLREIAGLKV